MDASRAVARSRDLEAYWNWLRGYTQQIDFRGLKAGRGSKQVQAYPMDDLFIPLMTYRAAHPGRREPEPEMPQWREMREPVPLEKALTQNQHLVIQGDAGSGKTTFLRYEAWQYCRPEPKRKGLPLFLSIARLDTFIQERRGHSEFPTDADSPAWLALYLAAQSDERKWGLDRAFFEARLEQSETVVLLDGLDEATNERRRESMARLFEAARGTYDRCRWVVTTRPGAYEGKATLADFAVARILELEQPQIDGFLHRWSMCLKDNHASAAEEHCDDLRKALAKSPWEIRKMARNPLMLSALGVVHYNESRLPDQRAELYECILKWLARSREKPGRPRDSELLKRYGYLALSMQDDKGKYRTRVSRAAAAKFLETKFKLAGAADFLAEDEIDSGIITSEGTKEIKFYHRTFQEYLAARYLAELEARDRKPQVEKRLHRPEWRETFVLLAGCLHSRSEEWLHGFFRDLLAHALGREKLEDRARVVGLMGSMLADLRAVDYEVTEELAADYEKLRASVMRIFDPDGAPELGIKTRAAVADALAQGGDPRLRLPGQDEYWVKVGRLKIGRFPVTVQEYAKFVESGGRVPELWEEQVRTPSRPVVCVSWHDANDYCQWVGGVRLPKDKEWENVAAGGRAKREYPWGAAEPSDEMANFGDRVGSPTAVGLFPKGATPDGVMDMAGNVWEWTADDHEHGGKSLRGGSFSDFAWALRAAYRGWFTPDDWYNFLGFRLVRE